MTRTLLSRSVLQELPFITTFLLSKRLAALVEHWILTTLVGLPVCRCNRRLTPDTLISRLSKNIESNLLQEIGAPRLTPLHLDAYHHSVTASLSKGHLNATVLCSVYTYIIISIIYLPQNHKLEFTTAMFTLSTVAVAMTVRYNAHNAF